jgi:hypothetical protein
MMPSFDATSLALEVVTVRTGTSPALSCKSCATVLLAACPDLGGAPSQHHSRGSRSTLGAETRDHLVLKLIVVAIMRGYKAPRPLEEHRTVVALLVLLALSKHGQCPGALVGTAVTHWATVVPSLPAKPGEHPLHAIASGIAPWLEVPLASAASTPQPRALNPDHFHNHGQLPPGAHVLLIDDAWASGGHAQSAALALRATGAARVSLLVVARWVKEDYGNNATLLRDLADRDYDPEVCPWTGSACPNA